MLTPSVTIEEKEHLRSATDALLRIIFPPQALIWIMGEEYGSDGPVWRVTLACQGELGGWMRRRYRYDIPSGTLHFAGEQPLTRSELQAVRQNTRRLT
ncbi:MAG: hypothetical protein EI684_01065 [Candidatus Viridilinea halotolerans]|uniref:Uncharacterized protein n=1 Tax=Candidatus Viridilinea halotolerans TaxID=2491704 RepID=A0A426UBG8_9CHLR|nr:MAG: hypothetical protein EI684_01065 [Candidatus Viridilinea halotolerans]